MSDDFNPLADYSPTDIPVDDIKVVALSEEDKKRILSDIDNAIKGAGTVKDILAVLAGAGKLTMALGMQILKQQGNA